MEFLLGPADSWWERGKHSRQRNPPGVGRGGWVMVTSLVTEGPVFSSSGFGQEPGVLVSGVRTPASAQLQGPGRRSEPSVTAVHLCSASLSLK